MEVLRSCCSLVPMLNLSPQETQKIVPRCSVRLFGPCPFTGATVNCRPGSFSFGTSYIS